VSFSPESGGRVKPRRAMEEMRTHGTIRLSFSLPGVSFSPESGGRMKTRRAMGKMRTHGIIKLSLGYLE
jgi:hypothetical protein